MNASLATFVEQRQAAIVAAVRRTYPPRYDAETRRSCCLAVDSLLRPPLGAQADAIRALTLALRDGQSAQLVAEMGTGKAQPLTARVLTPTGWRRMGDLQTGDWIVSSQGTKARILGVYPQGEKDAYRVTFSDGSSTVCSDEHLWLVNSAGRKWRGQAGQVLPLREIRERIVDGASNARHFIPLVRPVQFEETSLPLDPYLLGLLLGDGCIGTRRVTFTTSDQEIVAALRPVLPDGVELHQLDDMYWSLRANDHRGGILQRNPLLDTVRQLGLAGARAHDKCIPSAYQVAAVTSRIALLQGLMDTDGTVDGRSGQATFSTVSDQLARDVVALVQSLGGTATRSIQRSHYRRCGERRAGRPCHRLYLCLPPEVIPFRLGRKLRHYRTPTKYGPTRAVRAVEHIGTVSMQCLRTDAPDGLYVTDDFIVTHNTFMACAVAHLGGFRRSLIVSPPHLVEKWRREALATVPGAKAAIVRTIGDLERARRLPPPAFVVLSREQAKLGARWRPAAAERLWRSDNLVLRRLACPACGVPLVDGQGVPLLAADLAARKRHCLDCGGPLWQADGHGPRRVALAEYIRDRMTGHFDLLIADEVHEFKARGSAQGVAAATLAEACGKTLSLSGTLFGGYASSLFHLLWRFSPPVRAEFGYGEEQQWVQRYGIVERVSKRDPDAYAEDGRQSRRRAYLVRTVEKPGVAPGVLAHLLGNTVFLRLGDVARDLPPYTEQVIRVPLARGDDPDTPSQASAYRQLANDLRQAVMSALAGGSKRLLGAYLQALLAYPDGCIREETVLDPASQEVIAHASALSADHRYPKERALVELLRRERRRGRKTLVFVTHTETRDLTPRLTQVIAEAGLKAAVLKANTVAPAAREVWVDARVREGIDALICHPRLVQTGLDLLAFPSIVWLQPDYSVYTLRQASRRSWRIGSRLPVEVSFLVYDGTLQAEALALVAAKLRAALLIEGELPQDGLGELAGSGDDIFLALARRLAGQDEGDGHSLEALFAEARTVEAAATALVDASEAPITVRAPVPAAPTTLVTSGRSFLEIVDSAPRQRRHRPSGKPTTFRQPSLFDGE